MTWKEVKDLLNEKVKDDEEIFYIDWYPNPERVTIERDQNGVAIWS